MRRLDKKKYLILKTGCTERVYRSISGFAITVKFIIKLLVLPRSPEKAEIGSNGNMMIKGS